MGINNSERSFVELVNRAINCISEDDGYFDNVDWQEIYKLAELSGVVAALFDVAKVQKSLPEELRKRWDAVKFKLFLRQGAHFNQLVKVIKAIEAEGLDYAVFKGPVLADAYPNPLYRASSDTDILVDADSIKKAGRIIESLGYAKCLEKSKHNVPVYVHGGSGHVIELHSTVYEDYEGEKINVLRTANIDGKEHRIRVKINGKDICTFGYNEHLAYLIYHMVKHFMLEGGKTKFFTDITLFVNKHKAEISPQLFWDWMDKFEYTTFCENFFTICIKYFGMDEFLMDGRKIQANREVLEGIIIDYLYCGDQSQTRRASWQLLNTFEPYLTGKSDRVEKTRAGRIVRMLFPRSEMLSKKYSYAKSNKLLLPVAWVHRGINSIIYKSNAKEEQYSTLQKINLVDSRMGLLNSVGLLEKE